MAGNPELDPVSGIYTTGHEWDGIKELNTPLPSWWVWIFYGTIIWAVIYMIVYPSIPLGGTWTNGVLGWNSRTVLEEELAAAKAMHAPNVDKIAAMSVEEVLADDALSSYAQRGGEVIFKENCAPCHQTGGAGVAGIYPTLVDDEWIWGGTAEAIEYTVTHGIRNANYEDARVNDMPSFDDQLSDEEIDAVADYVVAASTGASLPEGLGQEVFVDNCAACHNADYDGAEPNGNVDMGGPALNNAIWLYDGSKAGIINQIRYPRNGVMPGFGLRLSETDIKQVSVYVHTRGGGQ